MAIAQNKVHLTLTQLVPRKIECYEVEDYDRTGGKVKYVNVHDALGSRIYLEDVESGVEVTQIENWGDDITTVEKHTVDTTDDAVEYILEQV